LESNKRGVIESSREQKRDTGKKLKKKPAIQEH